MAFKVEDKGASRPIPDRPRVFFSRTPDRYPMTTAEGPTLHLLIVDDDDELRQALERRFQRQGVVVTPAASGAEALNKAGRVRQDVALLDLHLPDTDGLTLLGKLKERQPELEAIMLTGHASVETAIQAMKSGAYDYLT